MRPARGEFWTRVSARLRGRASYALADQVVYSFGNMVIAALLSRYGPATQFGIYILTQRAMDILIQVSNVFLWAPYTFRLPGTVGARQHRYLGSIVLLQMVFAVSFSGLLFAGARWTASARHADLHATFAPMVIASAAILFREFTRRLYFAQLRLREAFWTDVATVGLQIAGVALLVRCGALDVTNTLAMLAAAAAMVSLWWLARDWQGWHVRGREVVSDFQEDFKVGRWFFGSNMVFLASAQCNPWVLSGVLGGASVGTYAIAESLVNIPRVAFTSMQNMMGPSLARAESAGGKRQVALEVRRLNQLMLLGASGAALGIWIVGPLAARLIYHRSTPETRSLAGWLALNLVVYACTLAQSYGLTAIGRAHTTFYANGLGLLVQALLCLPLVRLLHVQGAALAMLAGNLAVVAARQWMYAREMKNP